MSMIGYDTHTQQLAGLASGSTGDKGTFVVPPGKWELDRSFVVVAGASAHATAAIVKFDTVRGATRGDGDAGVIKKTASVSEIGKMIYWQPAATAAARVFLSGGDLVTVEVTTAQGEALAIGAGITLKPSPESQINLTNEVVTAA